MKDLDVSVFHNNKDNENYFSAPSPGVIKSISTYSNNTSFQKFSPIPQFDGNDTIELIPTPPPSYPPSRTISSLLTHVTHPQVSPPVGLRQTSFVMNKRKQVKKLGGDASRQDFKIETSPSRENVNIECSTGFYAQVVIPSLKTLKVGDTEKVAGLHVFCKDIIGKIDAAGSSVNTVLHFRFNHDRECVGVLLSTCTTLHA